MNGTAVELCVYNLAGVKETNRIEIRHCVSFSKLNDILSLYLYRCVFVRCTIVAETKWKIYKRRFSSERMRSLPFSG